MLSPAARREYLRDLRDEYLTVHPRVAKGHLLTEAEKRTGLHRKVLIRSLSLRTSFAARPRKKRAPVYDGEVTAALAKVWEIFDAPCGLRLVPLLATEVERLRSFGELHCSDEIAEKLQRIGPATIDRKLRHEKQVRHLSRHRNPPVHPLLSRSIPVKLTDEWDREQPGHLQIDYVAHCGASAAEDFCHTLSGVDIASGWWEGAAILGRSQRATKEGLETIRARLPFALHEIHPDNDSGMINNLLFRYCAETGVQFSRSRPHHKNDNAWVEQRNWTHVRKVVGYHRYDTAGARDLLNALYRDLGLFKNFFQPIIHLQSKERIGGHVRRTYEKPVTPHQWLLISDRITDEAKERLRTVYLSLNPAALKRQIEQRQAALLRLLEQRLGTDEQPIISRKLAPRSVTSFVMQPMRVRLPS